MPDQNLKNHARFDPPYHFFIAPVLLISFGFAVKHLWEYQSNTTVWQVVLSAALIVWAVKSRTYALKVQDRVIRLEERLRMEKLAQDLMPRFGELNVGQIVALRFASDAELPPLMKRALDEKLAPKAIKEAITNWRPDNLRV